MHMNRNKMLIGIPSKSKACALGRVQSTAQSEDDFF